MALTEVESLAFRGINVIHYVTSMTFYSNNLTMIIAPWNNLGDSLILKFEMVQIASKQILTVNPEFLWQIVGFNSHPLNNKRYKFILECVETEYVFEAKWPTIVTSVN